MHTAALGAAHRDLLGPNDPDAEGAVRAINMGFKLVTLSNESGLMQTYAKMQVNQTRKDSAGKA